MPSWRERRIRITTNFAYAGGKIAQEVTLAARLAGRTLLKAKTSSRLSLPDGISAVIIRDARAASAKRGLHIANLHATDYQWS